MILKNTKQSALFFLFFFTLLYSCNSKKNNNDLDFENEKSYEAIESYCNCVNEKFNDSLTNFNYLDTIKSECYKSIIESKFHLSKDNDFVNKFDSTNSIIQLNEGISKKLEKNITKLLEDNTWGTEISMNSRFWEVRKIYFDGVIFTQECYRIYNVFDGSWELENSWRGKYSIETEKNGKTYVYVNYDEGEKATYVLGTNRKNQSYLEGPTRIFWKQ